MNALISSLLGAASSALATLVAPVTKPGAGAADESQAGAAGFAAVLTAALTPQGEAVSEGTVVLTEAELESLVGDSVGDSEAMTAALDIAGALGAGMLPAIVPEGGAVTAPAAAGTGVDRSADPAAQTSAGGRSTVVTASPELWRGTAPVAATATVSAPANVAAVASSAEGTSSSAGPAADRVASPERAADDSRTRAATTADPRRVQSGLAPLDSEFRSKLDRVISRMQEEFGHEVQVVETVRSPQRQDFLFAQGRTRPGPVVTWTRDSNHEEGRAADLLIDGSYENALAFRRLARVAQEEGLRTLGARDPGHVELPGIGTSPRAGHAHAHAESLPATSVQGAAAPDPAAQAGVARVAMVAQVAAVAQPQVAAVASVASVGGSGRANASNASRPGPAPAATLSSSPRSAATRADKGADTAPARRAVAEAVEVNTTELPDVAVVRPVVRPEGESEKVGISAEAAPRLEIGQAETRAAEPGAREPVPQLASMDGTSGRATPASGPREVAGVFGADAAERIARALQIQDGAASRPLSQVTLRIDSPDGGEDRIRIDLRGGAVGASISTSDAGAAEAMNSRIGELQRALEKQGLEAEYLQVRSTSAPRASEMVDAVRMATVADLVGSRGASDTSSQRDRDEPNTREGLFRDREEENQNPRQRSRREPKNGRDQ